MSLPSRQPYVDDQAWMRFSGSTECRLNALSSNTTGDAYLDIARALPAEFLVTDDYVELHLRLFDLLEGDDEVGAREHCRSYLDAQAAVLGFLGGAP